MAQQAHPEPDPKDNEPQSTRSRFNTFFKKGLAQGRAYSEEQMLKSKLMLERSLGLGHQPNVIPANEADVAGPLRKVEIGWHPVGGFGGKWFAEQTGLGKMITKEVKKYPDPTQHWAVLVEGFCHELWMDEHLDVIYINEVLKRDEWHTFEVGKTRFNDEALRQAGEMTIHNMRTSRPAYNLISNNCQNFATALLDAIQIGAHREFATTFQVYQRATGKGSIRDLWVDRHPEEQKLSQGEQQGQQGQQQGGLGEVEEGGAAVGGGVGPGQLQRVNTVQHAQMVMEQETTKLDNHHKIPG